MIVMANLLANRIRLIAYFEQIKNRHDGRFLICSKNLNLSYSLTSTVAFIPEWKAQ